MNELTDKQIKEVYEEHASDDPDMHLPFARAMFELGRQSSQVELLDAQAALAESLTGLPYTGNP